MSANRKSFKQTEEILIVDDELANLRLLTQLLSDAGYHVCATLKPQLAVDSALAQQPDLILLDVRMPEMDGFEVCRRLKEDEKTKDIPILFVSAIQDMPERVRGFDAGAVDFISKPFQEREVLARVRTHMELRKMQLQLENQIEERTAELKAATIESKRARQALSESEAKYRNLVNDSVVGVFQITYDGRFVFINEALVQMFDFDNAEQMMGVGVTPLWKNPKHRKRLLAEVQEHGKVTNFEAEMITHTGRRLNVLFSVRLEGGKHSGMVMNITERKLAEEALEHLNHDIGERLKELSCSFAISHSARTKTSLDEIFQDTVAAIPAGWHYPDITRAKLIYDNKEWVGEPFGETQWKQSADIIIGGQVHGSLEVYYIEERPILDEGAFMTEERNLIDGIAGTLSETIERRQAEEERQESRALFDSYLSEAPVGMAVFDTDIRYVNLNQALADISGVSIKGHLQKKPGQIMPGGLGEIVENKLQDILRTNRPIIHEEVSGEIASEPGVLRHWLHSFFPIQGAYQKTSGIGVMVLEVTETKRFEEQLRQSQKMEALGTLASGVSHDINNMLYPILVNASLLQEKLEADSEEYKLLSDVVDSAGKAKDLVTQILVFGRRSSSVEHICDFVSVANEAMKLLRPALPGTISIELGFSSARIPVLCDSSQLYQVLVNLFTNALQAISGSGEIKIDLDTVDIESFECIHGTLLDGTFARLTVTDNGVGMGAETCANMFDPFFTTKEAGQGTGLGLSTVFGIVQNHGGGITVSSEYGSGTTVVALLPLAEDVPDESRDPTVSRQDDNNNENILFVDDVESIRKSAKVCLERSGYSVTTVSSGHDALQVVLESPGHFDLVMTDQAMANMTGEELSIELLRLRPDIPIVICTGHSHVISPESSKEAGIRAFLQKPLSPTELRRVVREVLDEAVSGQSS